MSTEELILDCNDEYGKKWIYDFMGYKIKVGKYDKNLDDIELWQVNAKGDFCDLTKNQLKNLSTLMYL